MRTLSAALGLATVFLASLAMAQAGKDQRRSGYRDMGPALQKMQDDTVADMKKQGFEVSR